MKDDELRALLRDLINAAELTNRLTREYEERVWPPDPDSQTIGVPLWALRRLLRATANAEAQISQ